MQYYFGLHLLLDVDLSSPQCLLAAQGATLHRVSAEERDDGVHPEGEMLGEPAEVHPLQAHYVGVSVGAFTCHAWDKIRFVDVGQSCL